MFVSAGVRVCVSGREIVCVCVSGREGVCCERGIKRVRL